MSCSISSSEQRLNDAAKFWRLAREHYFDPNQFRLYVQPCIQALRSVTFLLQKAKDSIPEFEEWYKPQQEKMRANTRLRWLVESRNKIEKQGDLETHSSLNIEYTDSWLPGKPISLSLPPETRPQDIIDCLSKMHPKHEWTEAAILKVQRNWVDSEWPEEEILTALLHAFSDLQELLIEAHQSLSDENNGACDFFRNATSISVRLPDFMTAAGFPAVSWFSFKEGQIREFDESNITLRREEIEAAVNERYGITQETRSPRPKSSFAEICSTFFERGKQMLQTDGYHLTIAIILTENDVLPVLLNLETRADKHILIRELASKCSRMRAIACILTGEAWVSSYSSKFGPHAANYPDKKEAFSLDGFHRDEGVECRQAVFTKTPKGIVFGETMRTSGGEPSNIMKPIVTAIMAN